MGIYAIYIYSKQRKYNKMTLDELIKKCDDNNVHKYVSILKPYSLFENTKKKFYICKRGFLGRMFKNFKDKYEVFENVDIEYGKIDKYKTFKNLDDAIVYLWDLIKTSFNL